MALEDHVCHDNAIQNFVSARPVSIYAGLWLYARLTDDWQNGLPIYVSAPSHHSNLSYVKFTASSCHTGYHVHHSSIS
jgi:hypothetical protein